MMKVYRVTWLIACVLLALVGASGALVASPAALPLLFVLFGVLGGLLPLGFVRGFWKRPLRDRLRVVVSSALGGGLAAGVFVGFAALLGAGGILLALLVLFSSPPAVSAFGSWLSLAPSPSVAHRDVLARASDDAGAGYVAFQPGTELARMTDAQLCENWCASYSVLHQRPSPVQLSATVAERQGYLDEFERRNASGFAAWLASGGARGASNPLHYLVRGRMDRPTINWDELTRGQEW